MSSKFTIISLIASIFISQSSYGYIKSFSIWKNEDTGKFIYLLGDSHTLGNVKANQKQIEYFITEVLDHFEVRKAEANVLFEDQLYFFTELNGNSFYDNYINIFPNSLETKCSCPVYLGKKIGFGNYSFKATSSSSREAGQSNGQTTWILDFARHVGATKKPYQSVRIKSIDPRIYHKFLSGSIDDCQLAAFAMIFNLEYSISDLNRYLDQASDSEPLVKELETIERDLEKDREVLLKALKNRPVSRELLMHHNIKELLDMNVITQDDLKNIKKVFEDENFLMKALDKVALWESTQESSAGHTFIVAGFKHKSNLEGNLANLGFREVYKSADEENFIKIHGKTPQGDRVISFTPDPKTLLPVGLEAEINKSLLKALDFLPEKK